MVQLLGFETHEEALVKGIMDQFKSDNFALAELRRIEKRDLPGLAELKSAGLLDTSVMGPLEPVVADDSPSLREDEDPLDDSDHEEEVGAERD